MTSVTHCSEDVEKSTDLTCRSSAVSTDVSWQVPDIACRSSKDVDLHQDTVSMCTTLEVDDSVSHLRQHEEQEQEGSTVGSPTAHTSDKKEESAQDHKKSQIRLKEASGSGSRTGCQGEKLCLVLGNKRQLSPMMDDSSVASLMVNGGELITHQDKHHPANKVKQETTSMFTYFTNSLIHIHLTPP